MQLSIIDREQFVTKLMELQGYETQLTLARRLRVHPSTITRVYSGQRNPGLRLVASVLRAFPHLRPEDLGLFPVAIAHTESASRHPSVRRWPSRHRETRR